MNAERWKTIRDVFDRALEHPPDSRAAFLDDVGANDPELRREVASLLEAHAATGPLDLLAKELVGPWTTALQTSALDGEHVGPYRIVREIGRGGMGTVYLAERDDGTYEHTVALKLVRYRLAGEDLLVRFLNERQILARLQHPNIARLLDGGMTDDGLPYFAMEYVDGRPIDVYCDAHRLSVRERLELFLQIGRAVHYAHRNLVVHRDLKPGNLLVTDNGDVRLLDFGIAKLLDEATPGNRPTRTGGQVMTPAYASPEQVRGESVTTATDVYALGVLLYELLTGRRPYRLDDATPAETERIVCDQEPPRPSTTLCSSASPPGDRLAPLIARQRDTTPDRLRRQLEGDLDTIVLKALQKDPDRRYASAEALVDDIQRHLDGLPVRARPNSPLYRARKFAGRHRTTVVAAALVVASLAAGLGGALWQARVAAQERDLARQETQKAEKVSDFLVDLFEASDPREAQGDTLTAYDLLARGEERLNDRLLEQPLTRAAMLSVLGRTHTASGSYADAARLLDTAVVLQERHSSPASDRARTRRSLAKAEVLGGRLDRAHRLYEESLSLLRSAPDADSIEVAVTLSDFGSLHLERGAFDAAETAFRQALSILPSEIGPADPEVEATRRSTLQHLALLFQETGRLEAAVPVLENLLSLQRAHLTAPHPDLALLLNDFGMTLQRLGQLERAETLLREAIAMQRELFGRDHPQLVFALGNLAAVVDDTDLAAADSLTAEALAIARRILEPTNPVVATSLALRAQTVHKTGRLAEADSLFVRAVEAARRAFPPGHPRIGWAQVGHARVLQAREDATRADQLFQDGTRILVDAFGPTHTLVLRAERWHADLLATTNRRSEAQRLLERQHERLDDAYGSDDHRTQATLRQLNDLRAPSSDRREATGQNQNAVPR